MALDVPSWVNLVGWVVTLAVTVFLYRSARVRLRAMSAKLAPLGPQVAGHDEQIGNLTQAVTLLVPPDARPTTAHRTRLPVAPADTSPSASTALAARAPTVPRLRVEIHRSPFPAEVYAVLARGDGRPMVLHVDARDVDMREGTMPVNVLHVCTDVVGIELPPERPRRRMAWVSRAMVLDCPDAPPPGPPAPVEVEGDRGGIIPGDPVPTERPEDIRFEVERRSQAGAQRPTAAGEGEPEEGRTRVYTGRAPRPPAVSPAQPAGAKRDTGRTSSPTLVSPGNEPQSAEPGEDDDGSLIIDAQDENGRPISERDFSPRSGPMSRER